MQISLGYIGLLHISTIGRNVLDAWLRLIGALKVKVRSFFFCIRELIDTLVAILSSDRHRHLATLCGSAVPEGGGGRGREREKRGKERQTAKVKRRSAAFFRIGGALVGRSVAPKKAETDSGNGG